MTFQRDLAELLRLSGQATPGEWKAWRSDGTVYCNKNNSGEFTDGDDAAFTAFSRNFIEAHRDELTKLIGDRDE